MKGYQLKHKTAIRCHWNGPGHNTLIPANKVAYRITKGKAQGVYHGPQCYQAALKKYEEMEKKVGIEHDE